MDEELVEKIARIYFDIHDYPHCIEVASEDWDWCIVNQPGRIETAKDTARTIIAALGDHLVGPGMVAVERGRWERVRTFAASCRNSMAGTPDGKTIVLVGGDLDPIVDQSNSGSLDGGGA